MTKNIVPFIQYPQNFLCDSRAPFLQLVSLDWLKVSPVREEYFVSRVDIPYTYQANGEVRTYEPQPTNGTIDLLWTLVENEIGVKFDMCFLNCYNDGSESIGWHSDDNQVNDMAKPIAILSLGATRTMQFRRKWNKEVVESVQLKDNSLIIMPEFSQLHYEHRILKDEAVTNPRISMTFRGCDA